MPIIINGSNSQSGSMHFADLDLGYEYPGGLDLRPGSELHDKILTEIVMRADTSWEVTQSSISKMQAMDNTMTAFIDLDSREEASRTKDKRKPVSIVIPVTYAIMQAIHTQYLSILASQDTLHPLLGMGPEDTIGAMLLEKWLDAQSKYYKNLLAYSTQARDFLLYGYGAIHTEWNLVYRTKYGTREGTTAHPATGEPMPNGEFEDYEEQVLAFEGNKLHNIDPYRLYRDPNVAIWDTENAEFLGFDNVESRMSCLTREESQPGWFNARYLIEGLSEGQALTNPRMDALSGAGGSGTTDRGTSFALRQRGNPIDVTYMYANIIPSEWSTDDGTKALGDSDSPQLWIFAVAGDSLVLTAQPYKRNHGRIPISIASPESDGYGASPMALMDITMGTQIATDFLWNAHMRYTRYMLKGRFIVDPTRVNMTDLTSGSEIIRVKRVAWNKGGLAGIVQPLALGDPTRGNIIDMGFLQDQNQRAAGVSDGMLGVMQTKGERRSAEEARGARLGAMGRVEKMLILAALQSHTDITRMMAHNSVQFGSQQTYAKLMGRWQEELTEEYGKRVSQGRAGYAEDSQGFFPINPMELDIDFDVQTMDTNVGSLDSISNWTQLYGMLAANPALMQSVDMMRVFKHIARLSGAKNASDFVLKDGQATAQVVADQQVAELQQQGAIAPVGAVQ